MKHLIILLALLMLACPGQESETYEAHLMGYSNPDGAGMIPIMGLSSIDELLDVHCWYEMDSSLQEEGQEWIVFIYDIQIQNVNPDEWYSIVYQTDLATSHLVHCEVVSTVLVEQNPDFI